MNVNEWRDGPVAWHDDQENGPAVDPEPETFGCDCCGRDGLTDDEIAEHGGDRDTPWGFMAVPTECNTCREERTP